MISRRTFYGGCVALLLSLFVGKSLIAVKSAVADDKVEVSDLKLSQESKGVNLAEAAEKIRSGRIDVGSAYSLKDKMGRFHRIHADKLVLDCTHCHIGKRYRDDYLSVTKPETAHDKAGGQFERTVCLGCHQQGGVGSAYYKGAARE